MRDDAGGTLAEPCFEPPPRWPASAERRLTGKAAARYAAAGSAHEFRDNAVTLARGRGGRPVATAVGRSVAAAFGLAAGRLTGAGDTLPGSLSDAFARLGEADGVVAFEGAVATPFAACVLLRGVLLPTLTGAEAVLSWKQVLDDDAAARLRAELLRELRPAAAGPSLAAVFA